MCHKVLAKKYQVQFPPRPAFSDDGAVASPATNYESQVDLQNNLEN